MRKVKTLALLLVLALALVACGGKPDEESSAEENSTEESVSAETNEGLGVEEGETKKFTAYGLEFTIQLGWYVVDDGNQIDVYFNTHDPSLFLRLTPAEIVDRDDAPKLNAESATAYLLEQAEYWGEAEAVGGAQEISVGGMRAWALEVNSLENGNTSARLKLWVFEVTGIAETHTFTVIYMGEPGQYEIYLPDADALMDSIVILFG